MSIEQTYAPDSRVRVRGEEVTHLRYLLTKSDEIAADQQITARLIERAKVVH